MFPTGTLIIVGLAAYFVSLPFINPKVNVWFKTVCRKSKLDHALELFNLNWSPLTKALSLNKGLGCDRLAGSFG